MFCHTHKSHDGSLGVSVCEERDDDRSSDKKTGPASHTHQGKTTPSHLFLSLVTFLN